MAYRCAILKTDGSEEATKHNDYWLGPMTLGIEVTQEVLAKRCGLGNIDPQHGKGSHSSAAEAALTWPLPPNDARLVTVRNDKDAVTAIAILALRIEGFEHLIDKDLVAWIGVLDRMNYQDACNAYPELAARFDRTPTDAMNYIIKGKSDRWPVLINKVKAIAKIITGTMPADEMKQLSGLRAEDRHNSQGDFSNDVEMYGNVAFIEAPGQYENARNWGNRRFEVALVYDDRRRTEAGGLQKRWSLVRKIGFFDRQGFEAAVNAAEAEARGIPECEMTERAVRWGGNENIISSPQGAAYGTKLSKQAIIALARKHLESGVVS